MEMQVDTEKLEHGEIKKKTMKIDLHTHVLPKNIPDLAKKYGYGAWVSLEHDQPVNSINFNQINKIK